MSTLSVATIKSLNSNPPVFQNSSGVEKGMLANEWISLNGYSMVIRASFGISSVTDMATGRYKFNFSTSYSNNHYSWTGAASTAGSNRTTPRALCQFSSNINISNNLMLSGSCEVMCAQLDNALNDGDFILFQCFGDK
tara:strand:+ start:8389 stop:8802 length:414 start_codon:yes stop_codon:yes gene_type:complete